RRNFEVPADGGIGMRGLQTAAVQDGELDHPGKIGKAMPGGKVHDVVLADQVNEIRVRLAGLQRFHCVDGVRWRGPLQLQRVQTKVRLAFDRSAEHFQAKLGRSRLLFELVRRNGGRNEDQAVEAELFE